MKQECFHPRAVISGGAGGTLAPPGIWEFSKSQSQPEGADYAHHITVAPPESET